jgi:predicted RNA binding protein YcfA (HicA-like mRNA interferase family)
MTGKEFGRLLQREPLSYSVTRTNGSHKTWESSAGYPTLHLAFHARHQVAPGLVRKILMKDVGLSAEEALAIL